MSVRAHPAWCSLRYCTVTDSDLPLDGGEHRSEPITRDAPSMFTNFGSIRPVTAYLTQAACPWPTDTFLHLEAASNDITLPLREAAGVLAQLTDLVAAGNT